MIDTYCIQCHTFFQQVVVRISSDFPCILFEFYTLEIERLFAECSYCKQSEEYDEAFSKTPNILKSQSVFKCLKIYYGMKRNEHTIMLSSAEGGTKIILQRVIMFLK